MGRPKGERRAAIDAGEEFYFTGRPCKRDHIAKRSVKNGCVECVKEHAKNRDKEKVQERTRHWRRDNPAKSMIRLAKKRNWPVDIDESDVIIPTHCPVLGIPIVMGTRTQKDGTPTLDRVDTSKGISKETFGLLAGELTASNLMLPSMRLRPSSST